MKITVLVSGGWGTALALELLQKGHQVCLWSRNPETTALLARTRENPKLPGVHLPENLMLSSDISCAANANLIVMSAPSYAVRNVCRQVRPYVSSETVIVSVTKGIEPDTFLRMSEVVEQETGATVAVLSGPSHAEEVARGFPTGCVAASRTQKAAELVQDVFMSPTFRIYASPDIIGVELGGALKNVIALCAGVCDGLGYEDNTKAMLMTRGLAEMARLGLALGAHRETFAGLAGIGDLIVTCTSMHSRNRRAGILIGQGKTPEQAMKDVGAVVEGYYAARSAYTLSQRMGVDMPICREAYQVLYEGKDVKTAIHTLLTREKRGELEAVAWEQT